MEWGMMFEFGDTVVYIDSNTRHEYRFIAKLPEPDKSGHDVVIATASGYFLSKHYILEKVSPEFVVGSTYCHDINPWPRHTVVDIDRGAGYALTWDENVMGHVTPGSLDLTDRDRYIEVGKEEDV